MKIIGRGLLILHFVLFLWAIGGYFEMVLPEVFWPPYTNPDFPAWLLVFHWGSVLFASSVYIYGYITRWESTPLYMAVAYGIMALVCLVETFGFMTSESKYIAMAAEYTAYILILFALFRSPYFINYFGK